jgi:superfamily II DNA or RNA helicase
VSSYADFLATKRPTPTKIGPELSAADVHPMLHDWQSEIVRWAVNVGRAAIWADTGLGKSFMQIEWARLVAATDAALIVAPLAVCQQTIREAAKLGVHITYTRDGIHGAGMWITNYEMVDHVDPDDLRAVVLDEASILKQSDGKTRAKLISVFRDVPFRLACTATPAPNDPEELTNQAEWLGRSTRANMLAAYFVHDTEGWRLKGHARGPMMTWMATWAIALRRPSDLGYPDDGYNLPGLRVIPHLLDVDLEVEGQLFATDLGGVGGRAKVRRESLPARCAQAVELVDNEPDDDWVVWCGLNDEQDYLAKKFGDRCYSLTGSQTPEQKVEILYRWLDGQRPILVTKMEIAGQGINMQNCARMIFVGLSDSYEKYYQAIRRCYRYGQTRVVEAHVVLSDIESQIADNIARKEREAGRVTSELVAAIQSARRSAT